MADGILRNNNPDHMKMFVFYVAGICQIEMKWRKYACRLLPAVRCLVVIHFCLMDNANKLCLVTIKVS